MTKKKTLKAAGPGKRDDRLFALPKDTRESFMPDLKGYTNLGLLIDKFAPWSKFDDEWDLTMRVRERRQGQEEIVARRGGGAKGIWLRSENRRIQMGVETKDEEIDPILRPNKHVDQQHLKHAHARWLAMVNSKSANTFVMQVDYRLVGGFGAEHVLETNLCLHRIFGFPIIPGSAIKGVTRAKAFWNIGERLDLPQVCLKQLDELLTEGNEEKQRNIWLELTSIAELSGWSAAEKGFARWQAVAHEFYRVFGSTERGGAVVFFDAYPVTVPTIEADILNPHYGDYYQDKMNQKPPADYYNPVPTFFLTVAKGTKFQFALASKQPVFAQTAETWLRQALTELGIGGKTAAGYGFWNLPA